LAIKVLFCDDSSFMRAILKGIILKDPFILAGEAGNGKEAVEIYKKTRPDLVTMDIVMPEMDGIDAVREIRAFDPEAKILMVSAMGQQSMVIDAIQAGARDFIIKPFQPPRVQEALKRVVGN
jgi:two-component system chemotaxis response regulator CheY